jgi:hypothetical protein
MDSGKAVFMEVILCGKMITGIPYPFPTMATDLFGKVRCIQFSGKRKFRRRDEIKAD